ncbi:putative ankyrin-repeat protein [Friedmanniomyces endolithicus]|nr:putative ankyrin-repeat protein [Friedmanniomyces endolithicus]
MHIQDLPIETFKVLLQHVACALDVESALRLRLISKLFANEMTEAIISTDALDEVCEDALALYMGIFSSGRELRVTRCPDESLKARYLYSRAQREPHGSDDFTDHLRLIVAEFVSKTRGRYDYDTALRTLSDIVVQTFNLSVALTDNPMFFISDERYSPNQACLSVACGLGDLDVVTTLLSEHDVKINPTEPKHFLSLPIRPAVRGGHKAIVDYLLQHGSRIEADSLDKTAWTIVHDSILNREPAMLAFLLEKELAFPEREQCAGERLGSAYEDALITAAYQDNDVAFNILVERGPIKAPFPEPLQQLVLMAACEGRSLAIARRFFEMNPALDPNYDLKGFVSRRANIPLDKQRQCPLQAAAHWGSMPLIQLLLNHGADPNWSNGYGGSALYRAASQGYDRCKDMLLRAGADADEIAPLG